MPEKEIILIGGGGHCKACIDVIEATGKYHISGIVDVKEKVGQKVFNYAVIASDEEISKLISPSVLFLITAGQIRSAGLRKDLMGKVIQYGGMMAIVISPFAIVSKHSEIGRGTIVMHKSVINAGAKIGTNVIINTGAIVEHDSTVDSDSHISTMACINGGCRIGSGCFIGSNAVVNESVSILNDVIVGSGSVVNRNITEPGIYAGNPVVKIK